MGVGERAGADDRSSPSRWDRDVKLTEEELVRWGRRIGAEVTAPIFVGLKGPLGAGKSVLARAVAGGAGVHGSIPSPTYSLVHRYDAREGVEVVHLDLYRLDGPADLHELGWDELGAGPEIVLIEWPERAGDLLPEDRWEIELTPTGPDGRLRLVELSRCGHPAELPTFPLTVAAAEAEARPPLSEA